jgi:hypothetical protein
LNVNVAFGSTAIFMRLIPLIATSSSVFNFFLQGFVLFFVRGLSPTWLGFYLAIFEAIMKLL